LYTGDRLSYLGEETEVGCRRIEKNFQGLGQESLKKTEVVNEVGGILDGPKMLNVKKKRNYQWGGDLHQKGKHGGVLTPLKRRGGDRRIDGDYLRPSRAWQRGVQRKRQPGRKKVRAGHNQDLLILYHISKNVREEEDLSKKENRGGKTLQFRIYEPRTPRRSVQKGKARGGWVSLAPKL